MLLYSINSTIYIQSLFLLQNVTVMLFAGKKLIKQKYIANTYFFVWQPSVKSGRYRVVVYEGAHKKIVKQLFII